MKYYDGFGKDVSEYVYELERKAALFDAQTFRQQTEFPIEKVEVVEPKIEVAEEEIKKPVRRTKVAEPI
jgi:hypothetical protein